MAYQSLLILHEKGHGNWVTYVKSLLCKCDYVVHGPGIETLHPLGIFGDNDFWIAQYASFQYLLVCKMNYSAFRDYLRWYIAA